MDFYSMKRSLKMLATIHVLSNSLGIIPLREVTESPIIHVLIESGALVFLFLQLFKDGLTRTNVFRSLIILRIRLRNQKQRHSLGKHLYDLILFHKVGLNLPPVNTPASFLRSALKHGIWARHKIMLDAQRRCGDTYCYPLPFPTGHHSFGTLLCFTANIQAIKQVMTDKETFPSRGPKKLKFDHKEGMLTYKTGLKWALHRKIVTQFLTEKNLCQFADSNMLRNQIETMFSKWDERNGVAELQQDLSLLTYEIITRFVTGFDLDRTEQQRVKKENFHASKTIDYATKWAVLSSLLPIPEWFPFPQRTKLRELFAISDVKLNEVIDMETNLKNEGLYNADSQNRSSMLSAMMQAKLEDGVTPAMDRKDLMDEIGTMFGAGHETTSNTLCWIMLLLARNKEKFLLLQEEVDREVSGRVATSREVKNLKYAHMVIYESLRMFPTVPGFPRTSVKDTVIDGFDIPAGSIVMVAQPGLNVNPTIWDSPSDFIPERFQKLPELKMSKPIGVPDGDAYGFLPFGAGQRTCVGQRFAMIETVVLLASIVKNYTWTIDQSMIHEVADITLGPKHGLYAQMKPRHFVSDSS